MGCSETLTEGPSGWGGGCVAYEDVELGPLSTVRYGVGGWGWDMSIRVKWKRICEGERELGGWWVSC